MNKLMKMALEQQAVDETAEEGTSPKPLGVRRAGSMPAPRLQGLLRSAVAEITEKSSIASMLGGRRRGAVADLNKPPDEDGKRFNDALDESRTACAEVAQKGHNRALLLLPSITEPLKASLKSGVFDEIAAGSRKALDRLAEMHLTVMNTTQRWQDHRLKAMQLSEELARQELKSQLEAEMSAALTAQELAINSRFEAERIAMKETADALHEQITQADVKIVKAERELEAGAAREEGLAAELSESKKEAKAAMNEVKALKSEEGIASLMAKQEEAKKELAKERAQLREVLQHLARKAEAVHRELRRQDGKLAPEEEEEDDDYIPDLETIEARLRGELKRLRVYLRRRCNGGGVTTAELHLVRCNCCGEDEIAPITAKLLRM